MAGQTRARTGRWQMAFTATAIANHFLDAARSKGVALTPLQIQKLVYFAHGWSLAVSGKPLIREPIQAWKFGPVIHQLYREFRRFKDQQITEHARDLRVGPGLRKLTIDALEAYEPSIDDDDQHGDRELAKAIIDRVLDVYGKIDGLQLSTLTHREGTPWSIVQKKFHGRIPPGMNIPNQIILEWFHKDLQLNSPIPSAATSQSAI
jgi:uncharacterized phage-associated protein